MKIDTDRLATTILIFVVCGSLALGGNMITKGAIEEVATLKSRVTNIEDIIEEEHNRVIVEPDGFWKSMWNGVSFKKYRTHGE